MEGREVAEVRVDRRDDDGGDCFEEVDKAGDDDEVDADGRHSLPRCHVHDRDDGDSEEEIESDSARHDAAEDEKALDDDRLAKERP
jgi:hypothetical protein